VRGDALIDPSLPCGQAHGLPDHFVRDRRVCPPAVARTREELGLRPHPAVVLTQGSEERGTERDLAIAAALAVVDPSIIPLPIDVAHLQMTQLTERKPSPYSVRSSVR
jgi:hypothetical protein